MWPMTFMTIARLPVASYAAVPKVWRAQYRTNDSGKRVISMTNSMASHSQYAIFLATQGRFEEAIAEVKLAEKIDLSGPATNLDMVQIYYWRHQDDQALEQGREMLRKDPPQAFIAHFFMGFPYIHKGEFENAIQEFKQSTVIGDAGSLSGLGYAYAMSGNNAETQNVLLRLKHP